MYIRRIGLTNFRCYRGLDLTLPCGTIVVAGRNAQGKTSLLEAAYVLATTRSPHAGTERELLCWAAQAEAMPFYRVRGEIQRAGHVDTVEVIGVMPNGDDGGGRASKQARVNNAARRALDVIGVLNVVLFTPRDLQLVDGPPSDRRRYLDVLLCQVDRSYCSALSRYNRALTQRNHLLRRLRDHGGDRNELSYWNDETAGHGSLIIARRLAAMAKLDEIARAVHADLAGTGVGASAGTVPGMGSGAAARGSLSVHYRSSLRPMGSVDDRVPANSTGETNPAAEVEDDSFELVDRDQIRAEFLAALHARREEEVARGVTVVGPHRDDLSFTVGGIDMRVFGSRGQQRTVTLAMKLAEARQMWEATGEQPVLLLDDVLSELDPERRSHLIEHIDSHQQTIITTTEPDTLPVAFLRGATLIEIADGHAKVSQPDRA